MTIEAERHSQMPPYWATLGPDAEGAFDGPSVDIEAGLIQGHLSWCPARGPLAWVDTLRSESGELSAYDLRVLSVWASTAAAALEEYEKAQAGVRVSHPDLAGLDRATLGMVSERLAAHVPEALSRVYGATA
jgi:hypothetical protein